MSHSVTGLLYALKWYTSNSSACMGMSHYTEDITLEQQKEGRYPSQNFL